MKEKPYYIEEEDQDHLQIVSKKFSESFAANTNGQNASNIATKKSNEHFKKNNNNNKEEVKEDLQEQTQDEKYFKGDKSKWKYSKEELFERRKKLLKQK